MDSENEYSEKQITQKNKKVKIEKTIIFLKGIILGMLIISVINVGIKYYHKKIYGSAVIDNKFLSIAKCIEKNYVNDYDKKQLTEGAYLGMLLSLNDKYSTYMTKEEFASYMDDTNGEYNGIGLYLGFDDEKNEAVVAGVFPNSPASKTEIKTGDIIISINDIKITDAECLDNAINEIKALKGSVEIVYKTDESGAQNTVEIQTDTVDIPSVSGKMLDDDIGYIIIASFDGSTLEQFETELKKLQDSNMQRLIIDLRDNPGGLMRTVVPITNKFIPKGFVTYTEDKNGKREYQYSDDEMLGIPLVVLVNGNSASASEVMCGAIKDTGVGKIVGTKTYGKGVVQNIFSFPDGSGMKLTTSKYYTPSGKCIDGIGIEPDYEVEYQLEEGESYSQENDLQLKKAIEVVKEIG